MTMEINADISGVVARLTEKSLKGKKEISMSVMYDTDYALYVHEDLTKNHPVGQAKFLEEPAKKMTQEMADIVYRSVKAKNGLKEGVERAVKKLLKASQDLVPVDKGNLKASGKIVEG